MKKTNLQLQHDVIQELEWDDVVDAAEIGVTAQEGIISLSGTVRSLPEKWAASSAAECVSGVKAVVNEVEVKLPFMSQRTDEDIARAAINALEWNIMVPHDRLKVTVDHGRITLEGTVKYRYERNAAEKAVRGLQGVISVVNEITVDPPNPISLEVKARIKAAFHRNADVNADNIDVEIQGNTVVLKGTVRSLTERYEAKRSAWSAPGVAEVKDQLTVAV